MPTKITKRTVEALKAQEQPYEMRDGELRGFLVRVEPSGARSFFLDYRVNGRRNRYRLGTYPNLSADGARELAKVAAGDVAKGIDVQARRKAERTQAERARRSTLSAFLERYETWEATHCKGSHAARIRGVFPAAWLSEPLTALDAWKLEAWRRDARKRGKAPDTINRDVTALKSALSKAVQWGLLDVSGIGRVKQLKTDPFGRVRFLTGEEEKRLRSALRERDREKREARARGNRWRTERDLEHLPPYPEPYADHIEPFILLLLNTGMRFGEATQLRHRDVDLSDRLLTVVGAGAKSGKTRVIPLNLEAHLVLSALKGVPDDYVFPGEESQRLTTIKTAWKALLKDASISDLRLHDLRHTFASRVKRGGADLYAVQRLLGHSTPVMTQRYAHLQPDDLRAAVEKVAS